MLTYLDNSDYIILAFGVALRFGATVKKKIEEFGDDFKFSRYFNARHVLRWSLHLICSVGLLLTFPAFLLEYVFPNVNIFNEIETWSSFGSAVLGFGGYDFIKFFEKLGVAFIEKIGLKIEK